MLFYVLKAYIMFCGQEQCILNLERIIITKLF